MKWLVVITALLSLLSGCADSVDPALQLRQQVLSSGGCSFQSEITADYGDTLSVFTLDCKTDSRGDLSFTVSAPQSIQGITGCIASGKGKLTFDDKALSFPLLADGTLSPISSPWVVMRGIRSGQINSCGTEGSLTRLSIDDSFREDALQIDLWLDSGTPVRAELCHKGVKIVSMNLREFRTLSDSGA